MKKNKLLASLLLLSAGLSAQEVISSQGDSYVNANNSLDFTIGETVVETVTDGANELTQGFHQTLLTITSVEDFDVNYSVKIFPNPTAERVTLSIEKYEGVTFYLFDIAGKLLREEVLTAQKTVVEVSDYAKGTYLLKLVGEESKKLKTFKIIKK
jgi:hypothetical protein